MRHPSPLIQLTANSEDQVRNAYRPLVAMIKLGPLKQLLKVREGFIRILRPGINLDDDDLDLDRIDVVTASATSAWVIRFLMRNRTRQACTPN